MMTRNPLFSVSLHIWGISISTLNNIVPPRPIDGISTYNVIPFEAGDFL